MFSLKYYPSKEAFKSLGFKFVEKESYLKDISLPDGWSRSKEKQMTYFYDEKNRLRASMLRCKKKFTGEEIVVLRLFTNFSIGYQCDKGRIKVYIFDASNKTTKSIGICKKSNERFEILWAKAKFWLNNNYPEWENPLKYWG